MPVNSLKPYKVWKGTEEKKRHKVLALWNPLMRKADNKYMSNKISDSNMRFEKI